jgi:hypothetical protein
MADNYLENKYEEYLKKKAEYERKKKLGLLSSKPATSKPTEPKTGK